MPKVANWLICWGYDYANLTTVSTASIVLFTLSPGVNATSDKSINSAEAISSGVKSGAFCIILNVIDLTLGVNPF